MIKSKWLVLASVFLVVCISCANLPAFIFDGSKPLPTRLIIPTHVQPIIPVPCLTCAPGTTQPEEPKNVETPIPEPKTIRQYQVQSNMPLYIQDFAHPKNDCKWMGVAGQIFNTTGYPLINLVLVVKGTLNGIPVNRVSLAGSAQAYGRGGYEIGLSKKPIASDGSLKITVFDLKGKQVSDSFTFNTYNDCEKNLIMVNYNKVSQ